MTNVIGLCGAAGSGKSVAADELEQNGFVRVRFSSFLKAMMRGFFAACGLSEDEIERRIEGDLKEVPDELLGGKTPRYAMQTLGTEWGRELISPTIWSNAWRARAEAELARGNRIVAEDVRFETEDLEVHRLAGKIIKLTGCAKDVAASGHASEAMEGIRPDAVVENDGAIEDLRAKVRDQVKEVAA